MDYPNLIPENNQPRATASDRTEYTGDAKNPYLIDEIGLTKPTFRPLDPSDLPSQPAKPSFFTPGSAALTKLLAWVVAILLSVAMWLFLVIQVSGRPTAPGGKSLPGRPAFGFSVSADPGPSFFVIKNSEHISDFQIVSGDKLKVRMSSSQARMHGMGNVIAKECLGDNHRNSLYNYYYVKYECLRLKYQNNIWCLLHNNTLITCLNAPDTGQFGPTTRTATAY